LSDIGALNDDNAPAQLARIL